jgi:hypothetical protein
MSNTEAQLTSLTRSATFYKSHTLTPAAKNRTKLAKATRIEMTHWIMVKKQLESWDELMLQPPHRNSTEPESQSKTVFTLEIHTRKGTISRATNGLPLQSEPSWPATIWNTSMMIGMEQEVSKTTAKKKDQGPLNFDGAPQNFSRNKKS